MDHRNLDEDHDCTMNLKGYCNGWKDACDQKTITCPCGQLRAIELAFRCLYCGIWFCHPCAEIHFGQTFADWVKEKRVEKASDEFFQ